MEEASRIVASVTFLPPEAGGRARSPHDSPLYRPHLVVRDSDERATAEAGRATENYLGVRFTGDGRQLSAGVAHTVTLDLPYYARVDYSDLRSGATFVIREGGKTVGFGRVLRGLSNDLAAAARSARTPMQPHIREVDFAQPGDAAGVVAVLDSYAADPTGDGRPLAPDVRERLIPLLRDHPTALALLASADGEPVGLAICFFGLSTFRARPLLNIHDLAIIPEYRGRGVGRALLAEVEKRAVRRGCCKLTLEVQEDNAPARALYQSFGFGDFRADNSAPTRFLSKPLDVES